MDPEEARQFLTANNVQIVIFPDGRKELHGFGKKLGDVFCGVEQSQNGLQFTTRFTPVPECVAKWN